MSHDPGVTRKIFDWLDSLAIAYRVVEHPPTPTSQDSANARGEPLGVGAKALFMKFDDTFRILVLPADCRLDSSAARAWFKAKKARFATADELLSATGMTPGSLPPFGPPIFPFELYGDASLGERYDRVAFNAGSLTTTVIMSFADWLRAAQPRRFAFSSPAP